MLGDRQLHAAHQQLFTSHVALNGQLYRGSQPYLTAATGDVRRIAALHHQAAHQQCLRSNAFGTHQEKKVYLAVAAGDVGRVAAVRQQAAIEQFLIRLHSSIIQLLF